MKAFLNEANVIEALLDSAHDVMAIYKFRCPNCYHCDGIHCDYKCSDSDYGLVVHVPTKENPRIFTVPARDSKEWKLEYNKRTSSER